MSSAPASLPRWPVAALAALGLAVRLAGLLPGRLLSMFPTEDGYLMLQVARNIALGHGMSTAGGAVPTNGVQPLATLVYAGLYALVDGDRRAGVALVLGFSIAVSIAAALLLARVGRRVLAHRPGGRAAADLAAAAWFASPVALPHTMNALESGLYALLVLAATAVLLGRDTAPSVRWSPARLAAAGVLLGLVFQARNDGAFFVLAATTTHLGAGLLRRPTRVARRLGEAVAMGLVSIVVASPWLVFNALRFGSIVPVSGQAEGLDVAVGHSLYRIPPVLVEILGVVVPIPAALEIRPWVIAACTLGLLALLPLAPRLWRVSDVPERRLEALVGVYGAALVVFYGLFFGAPHFVGRYLFPLSPFAALLLAMLVVRAWGRLGRLAPAAAAALLLVVGVAHARFVAHGDTHAHFHVVDWVQRHVPDETWVGAIQTGTLGYFHDRTLNLDGKVNPAALEARRQQRLADYVVASDIQYLADWNGIAGWYERFPVIRAHFDKVVDDPRANLGVLARHGAPRRSEPAPDALSPPRRGSGAAPGR